MQVLEETLLEKVIHRSNTRFNRFNETNSMSDQFNSLSLRFLWFGKAEMVGTFQFQQYVPVRHQIDFLINVIVTVQSL